MKIIAGKNKGATLYLVKDKNTRPLKDIVRESVFNLLSHSNKILFNFEKSRILDLYSGTGSFGLECLSRQAGMVYFVEKEKIALKILEKNIEKLKFKSKSEVISQDVFKFVKKIDILEKKFDIIFCDPPFKNLDIDELIVLVFKKKLLKKNGTFILHRNKSTNETLPNFFNIIDQRNYGVSKIIFGNYLF